MGFSLSWIAVRGGTPEAVQESLAVRGTGAREDFPESNITGAKLPRDWYLVVSDRDRLRLTKDEVMNRLSLIGEAVSCYVEEHVMVSSAACWEQGRFKWSVLHDAQIGIENLETKGQLPASFADISGTLLAKQSKADRENTNVDHVFDIPVELAVSVAGYRYDRDVPGMEKQGFEVLIEVGKPPERRPWWRKLLG